MAVALALAIGAFFAFGGNEYLSFEAIKQQQGEFQHYYQDNPIWVIAAFMGAYILVTALSLPGAAILTLLAGVLFDLLSGVIMVSIASTLGATLAFLAARFILGSAIQKRYGNRLKRINEGVKREGGYYLFALRLVPIFPFFLINLAMGLTPISIWKYMLVSWLGMIPGTIAYVYAGTKLAEVPSPSDVLSADLLVAFAILGFLPLLLKKGVNHWRKRRGKEAL